MDSALKNHEKLLQPQQQRPKTSIKAQKLFTIKAIGNLSLQKSLQDQHTQAVHSLKCFQQSKTPYLISGSSDMTIHFKDLSEWSYLEFDTSKKKKKGFVSN